MENSKIKLIFPNFFIFIFIFTLITQKKAYKMGQKFFSQIFMKISIYHIFSNKCKERLFKNPSFQGGVYSSVAFIYKFEVLLIQLFSLTQDKQLKKLQIFKITNLQNYKTTNLLLNHIHFFIGILFIRERNEWVYGITFVN